MAPPSLLERPLLLSYPLDVCGVHLVPCDHVLVDTVGEARLLAARDGGPGRGDAPLEAVLVHFLALAVSWRKEVDRGGDRGRADIPR